VLGEQCTTVRKRLLWFCRFAPHSVDGAANLGREIFVDRFA
jgi:hypothetical protein